MKKIRRLLMVLCSLSLLLNAPATEIVKAYEKGDLKPGIYRKFDNLWKDSFGNPDDWITSGNYSYEFLDSAKTYISIRKIREDAIEDGKLVIPKEIDGYKVLGIGIWGNYDSDETDKLVKNNEFSAVDNMETVQELVIPEGVEYLGFGSFYGCTNLKKIKLPESLVWIATYALCGSPKVSVMEFSPGVVVERDAFGMEGVLEHGVGYFQVKKIILYSDCKIPFGWKFDCVISGDNSELHIRYHKEDWYELGELPGKIQKLHVDKRLSHVEIDMPDPEDEDINCYYKYAFVQKLIMNGKSTELVLPSWKNVNMEGFVKGLYTVKGAKSIKEAKKYYIPYYWKETGKPRNVTGKKENGEFTASWKKVTTTVYKHIPGPVGQKYTVKKKPVKTVYKVYGKRKKSGSYTFIKTTTKRKIRSAYRYIKAVPVKEWL